jgi:hypothetical protein
MPTVKVVTLRALLTAAGFSPEQISSALANGLGGSGVWRLCTPVGEDDDLNGSKLFKSIKKYVDDDEKRSNFLVMLTAIARAATQQDYGAVLSNSVVTAKPAYKFNYRNKQHTVLELKHGKKDRIYFYPEKFCGLPCIVLLLAHHKKDQTTPKEVTTYCETTMKAHLASISDVSIT